MRIRGTTAASPALVVRALVSRADDRRRRHPGHSGGRDLDSRGRHLRGGCAHPAGAADTGKCPPPVGAARSRHIGDRRGGGHLERVRHPRPRATAGFARRRPLSPRVSPHHPRHRLARHHPHSSGVARRADRRSGDRDLGGPRDLAVPHREHGAHRRRRHLPGCGPRLVSVARRRARRGAAVAPADARTPLRVAVVSRHFTRADARRRPRPELGRPREP